MSDIFSKKKRSEIMSSVKTRDTDIEKILREIVKEFWRKNRYRVNLKKLPGKPDVVFLRRKIALFADGDFWHGKNFESWKIEIPEFWKKKIGNNILRDKKQNRKLNKMGYKVLRFWGTDLQNNKEKIRRKIEKTLFERKREN